MGAALSREELAIDLATRMRILLRARNAKSQKRGAQQGNGSPRQRRVDPATRNALAVLGLGPGASRSDAEAAFGRVKRDYHQAMRRSHPDVSDCHHSVAQKINEAYDAHRKAWKYLQQALGRA